ncbi:hypothetical protein R3P38DRAFT_3193020 [Favolaschia claudopus]|uniref:Uncharacterized protein n=1 Tax=Favolaschia claudopus TaxID=2862362 RepID=A0AAW0BIV2_9AGAR
MGYGTSSGRIQTHALWTCWRLCLVRARPRIPRLAHPHRIPRLSVLSHILRLSSISTPGSRCLCINPDMIYDLSGSKVDAPQARRAARALCFIMDMRLVVAGGYWVPGKARAGEGDDGKVMSGWGGRGSRRRRSRRESRYATPQTKDEGHRAAAALLACPPPLFTGFCPPALLPLTPRRSDVALPSPTPPSECAAPACAPYPQRPAYFDSAQVVLSTSTCSQLKTSRSPSLPYSADPPPAFPLPKSPRSILPFSNFESMT